VAIVYEVRTKLKSIAGKVIDQDVSLGDHPVPLWRKLLWRIRYLFLARRMPLTRNDQKINAFRDSLKGQRVWIIGNGPSIADTDLARLSDEVTIGTNSIFLNEDKMGFSVTHYVVEDYLVAEDRTEEIEKISGSTKWFGNYLSYCLPKSKDTLWMNVSVDYRDTPTWPRFSRNISRIAYVGGTVTYLCIQLAYFLGASEVILVGIDHSYVVEDLEQVEGNTITSTRDDVNHFHPDYFGTGKRWHLPRVDRMERAYVQAREIFEEDGRRIVNATKGGNLEVFPRVDYDRLVKQ